MQLELQGAAGIFAPVSVSYPSLLKLERQAFIATISFFLAMGLVQLPVLIKLGVTSWDRSQLFCYSVTAGRNACRGVSGQVVHCCTI